MFIGIRKVTCIFQRKYFIILIDYRLAITNELSSIKKKTFKSYRKALCLQEYSSNILRQESQDSPLQIKVSLIEGLHVYNTTLRGLQIFVKVERCIVHVRT